MRAVIAVMFALAGCKDKTSVCDELRAACAHGKYDCEPGFVHDLDRALSVPGMDSEETCKVILDSMKTNAEIIQRSK